MKQVILKTLFVTFISFAATAYAFPPVNYESFYINNHTTSLMSFNSPQGDRHYTVNPEGQAQFFTTAYQYDTQVIASSGKIICSAHFNGYEASIVNLDSNYFCHFIADDSKSQFNIEEIPSNPHQ